MERPIEENRDTYGGEGQASEGGRQNMTDTHAREKEEKKERKPAVRKKGQHMHLFDKAGQYKVMYAPQHEENHMTFPFLVDI